MSSSCPTCLEVFTESSHILSTPCGHIFHQNCIDRWLRNETSCPQCRKNSPRSELRRIYLSTSEGASSEGASSQPANAIKKFGVCIIGTDGSFSNSAFQDIIKIIQIQWLDLDDNEETKFIVSKYEWYQVYIDRSCDCTGTGKIDCGNEWTQDWILDLLKEKPNVQCLRIEDYNELKHVSVKYSGCLQSEIGFGKAETVKMIKKALKLSEKSIERHLNNIEDSKGQLAPTGQLIYLCLLGNNDVNALDIKNYKFQAGCEQLTFEIIEKNTSQAFECYKC